MSPLRVSWDVDLYASGGRTLVMYGVSDTDVTVYPRRKALCLCVSCSDGPVECLEYGRPGACVSSVLQLSHDRDASVFCRLSVVRQRVVEDPAFLNRECINILCLSAEAVDSNRRDVPSSASSHVPRDARIQSCFIHCRACSRFHDKRSSVTCSLYDPPHAWTTWYDRI